MRRTTLDTSRVVLCAAAAAAAALQCFTAPGYGRSTKQVGTQTVVEVTEWYMAAQPAVLPCVVQHISSRLQLLSGVCFGLCDLDL
jgi:hypothetical protein